MENKLFEQVDIEKIANEGEKIYENIKADYDPKEKGKFLAIEIDSQDVFLENSSSEALQLAKQKYPDKVFYVVKIGYDSIETMAKSILEKQHDDFTRWNLKVGGNLGRNEIYNYLCE
ncbi:hypothetical protein D4R87_02995 [bacterium]|nr:MAG: hypothetical protein D4R87_02995 [bacterium]